MDIEQLLAALGTLGGSDLHLKPGSRPLVRVNGQLRPLDGAVLSAENTKWLAQQLLPPRRLRELQETGDAEVASTFEGIGRYRVNVYHAHRGTALVLRHITPHVPAFRDLLLPPVVEHLAEERRGLILLTGPAGTGKTTTIAAMIGHINRTRRCHILTLEDPIEVLHHDALASVDQREVGTDMPSYAAGLRYAVRQDPDVLFIGEIRDEETAEAALKAAETGHLVISTLHTIDAAETLNRLINLFLPAQQYQVRRSLAGSLRGVIAQRLIPRASGTGRVPAVEVLVVNGRVSDEILEPGKGGLLSQIMEEGETYGMQTFDQSLLQLVRAGLVNVEDARVAATNPHDFGLAMSKAQIA